MTHAKTLAQNTFYLTLASVGQKVIAFLYFTIIARFVGVEDTGAYFLALAIITVIAVLDDVGITSVVIRETAKKPEGARDWLRNAVAIKLITMPLTVVIAFAAPVLLGYGQDVVFLIRLGVVVMLADTLSLTFYGVLRGLHALRYESIGIFIGQCSTAAAGLVLMATGEASLPLLVVALMIGSLWNVLFSAWHVVRRLGWSVLRPDWSRTGHLLKLAVPFFLAAVFVKLYSYVDSIVLSKVIGTEAVGIYAVAYKLTYAFQFLPLAFVASLYPTLSAQAHNPVELKKTLLNAFWYMALLGSPIVFGLFAIAPEVIIVFYGTDFAEAIFPLQVLIFVLVFIFLDFPIGSMLNATNRASTKTGIMGATMVINIVANVLLIPAYGVVGATYAALLSFSFMFFAGWYFVQKVVKVTAGELFARIGGLFFAGAVMAAVVLLTKPYVHFVLAIPLGAVVYIAIAFAVRSLRIEHLQALRRLTVRSQAYVKHPADNS